MKIFCYIFLIIFCCKSLKSQTVIVSGQCITDTIVLNPNGTMDGKPVYSGIGTVAGISGTQVNVYWLASDNLWALDFDGQPYFQNSCGTSLPPATGDPACVWSSVIDQPCSGAIILSITGLGTTLAVTLTGFTATINNKHIIVNWKTAGESNNNGFEILRSPDAINWNSIGFVNRNTGSPVEKIYQFLDLKPLNGRNYYRLLQVEQDGKKVYSRIVSVNFLKSGFCTISGNSGNNIYQVNLDATTEKVKLFVIDASGKRVMAKTTVAGIQTIDLTKFPPGIYMLRIIKGTDLFIEKLVKY